MSCAKLCLIVACLGAALSLAPSAAAIPSGLLSVFANQTICESEVKYDEDPNRIPRVIKEVKCASMPDKMCPPHEPGGEQVSCCKKNSYLDTKFSCQEVIDTVLVSDVSGTTSQKTVSVGCACVMRHSVSAEEA